MAIPTRQMGRPQPRPMQPFRQSQSPAMQQPMQRPAAPAQQMSARAMPPVAQRQVGQQQLNATASPLRNPITSPRVAQPQAMQPTSTRVQQPMQRSQLNAPAVMPREMPTSPYDGSGMPGRTIPGTNLNGTRYGSQPTPPGSNFGMMGGSEYSVAPEHREEYRSLYGGGGGGPRNPDGTPLATTGMGMNEDMLMQPGDNELSSTGQQGMPKYDPRSMPGSGYSGGIAGPSREEMERARAEEAKIYGPGGLKDQARQSGGLPPGGWGGYDPFRGDPTGGLKGSAIPLGATNPDGSPLATTGQRGMPQYQQPISPPQDRITTGMGMNEDMQMMRRGGKVTAVKKYAKGGTVKSTPVKASSRGDGIAQRGKTKGKIY